MSKSSRLDLEFAKAMQDHPYGIAMYRPARSTVLRPGTVGYFDDFGAWNIIVDLTDPEDLASKGLGPMNVAEIEAAPVDDEIQWGPILSTNTKSSKVSLSGGVSDAGAIMLTSPPVRHERFYHTSPFKQWMNDNSLKILKKYPDEIKQHGLWIITATHTTDKCSILMWREQGKKIHVGFSADVSGAGSIKPDLEWYGTNTDEGWGEYTANGEDRPVVFFGGLRFTAHRWYNPKKGLDLRDGVSAVSFRMGYRYDPRMGYGYNLRGETIGTVTDPEDEDHEFRFEVEERLPED